MSNATTLLQDVTEDHGLDNRHPASQTGGAAERCGCAILDEIKPLDYEIRAGLHTGEHEMIGDDDIAPRRATTFPTAA